MKRVHRLAVLLAAILATTFWSTGASAACLTRNFDNVAQVLPEERGQPHQIIVADDDIAALEAKGFRPATCAANLADKQAQLDYRNALCEFVAKANDLVERQIEKALGAPPAQLCLSAEKVLGRWNGEPGPPAPKRIGNSARIIDGEEAAVPASPKESRGDGK